jgi:hypothetical protein
VSETDTASPATLFDFISWAREYFRAERYMVILSGHGAGTEDDFLLKDEHPTDSLSIPRLGNVFEAVQKSLTMKVDILGMDVCLMSMVEVCYQLNGLVEYLVASESFSPAAGWPYGQLLTKLQEKKDDDTEVVASSMVGEFIGFYNDYVISGLSVDQAVLKVSASDSLVTAVKNFTQTTTGWLTDQSFRDAIILAHWEAQSYNGELFVDLRDLCERLQARYPKAKAVCRAVTDAIDEVVLESCFTGVENQFSNGVSIYFPWSEVAPSYARLAFAKQAGWNEFLREYVERTRRNPRGFTESGRELLNFAPDVPPKGASASSSGTSGSSGDERFRKSEDRKSEDRGKNPIRSMRNPPISVYKAGLSDCIRTNRTFVKRLEAFSKIRPPNKQG